MSDGFKIVFKISFETVATTQQPFTIRVESHQCSNHSTPRATAAASKFVVFVGVT
jgi:hypothetical protein